MRPTYSQEIVLEGNLEARVAAQLLTDAGRADLLEDITPPIEPPAIGRLAFVAALGREQKDQGDTTEYIVSPAASIEVVRTLARSAEAALPGQPVLSRKRYMGQKLIGLSAKLDELVGERPQTNAVEVGGMVIVGVSDEEASVLKRREAFVTQYFAKRKWDKDKPSIEQLLEVRRQPDWQNPPETA